MNYQDEDEVVISGIGGKFPKVENVAELAEMLLAGESLLTKDERTLTKGFYESLPEYNGTTPNNTAMFDNTFFGISTIVAMAMDPLTCQILQRTFEAVIDAGINPSELRGTQSSVFSGTCHSDSDLEWATDTRLGYGIMGRNRCMNSNRVSYWLDLNGTSVSTDSGWTNGLSNLFLGWNAIKSGKSDIAIVSTASIQCHALITIQFKDFGCLSPDGLSRTFDDAANGTGRSSAIVVLVLQRAKYARRSYATIGHVFSTCYGNRDDIINKPSQREWESLFKEFYKRAKIDVNDVHYIEAHGSSLREEDAAELNAINEVFCKNRKNPLLVGCVKSNMGNTEAASAFCGVVKCVIALERGLVPQNLNYKNPNTLALGLVKGQLKVVNENTPIPMDKWIAINSHGYGGTFGHAILKANPKTKGVKPFDGIPRLILLADRTNDYMKDLLEKVESVPYDPEFIALLHQIHSKRVEKYLGRGYTILPKSENTIHEHQVYGEEKRPIWFIFSGMGSQWPKMGKRLMDLPMFRESIEKSHKLLAEKGLDLINIITTDDPHIFDNILHSFVGIAAVQVALVDVLNALKITPDGLIGHSVGELGCAYADGCFTSEQMVLAAYYRGRASTEAKLIKGSMAAVGKGYNDIKDQLPEGIEIACHNSDDSCTLSGPVDLIHKYVSELKEKGIFAKSVNVSNIAYHSRYIKPAAPKLLEYLKQVVTDPKPRSSKWISTSNPESTWETPLAKYSSAEYHTNNLLSSVLFEEGSKHIPKNAICIEIAPHGLLQAILKRSLGENVTNIPLTSRSAEDPLIFFLQSIGKMYMCGINPFIVNLYPKIEYPVSRGTHILHHLVHWHEQKSTIVTAPMGKKVVYSFKDRLVNIADDGTGYIANGQNIYPVSIFLQLAWEIFASFQKKTKEECPVVFTNFRIQHPISLHLSEDSDGTISFQTGSGYFEIFTDHLIASGYISLLKDKFVEGENRKLLTEDLTRNEIYTEIKRKGYEVGETFKILFRVSLNEEELIAEIPNTVNWAQLIESFIQLHILQRNQSLNSIAFPYVIEKLEIFKLDHGSYKSTLNKTNNLVVTYDINTNITTCRGIRMRGLKTREILRNKIELKFECTNFLPLNNPSLENNLRFADFCFGIVLDNINAIKNVTDINILEFITENQTSFIGRYLQQMFHDYKIKVKMTSNLITDTEEKNVFEFIITPLSSVEKCMNLLIDGGFILVKTNSGIKIPLGFNLIGSFTENPCDEYLLLKKVNEKCEDAEFFTLDDHKNHLVESLRNLKLSEKNVYLVSYKEPIEGISSFKSRMQAETIVPLRWIFILDNKAPAFDNENSFYAEQLEKDLFTNVYKNGAWGGYCLYNFSETGVQEDVNFILESSSEVTPSFIALDLKENLLNLQLIEYSGKIDNKKVMGITKLVKNKKIVVNKYLTWEIPESWSLEEGASTPLSYALAYYCLVTEGKVKKNENVLITDGMNSISQACIAVALKFAKRVFVTVANEGEAKILKQQYPQLNESDVINHENSEFEVQWKLLLKNEYAQLIINMLDGEKFFSIVDFSGQFGRIFHFGREDLKKNKLLGSSIFLNSLNFYARTPEFITKLPEGDKKVIHELVAKGIKEGLVKPLPRINLPFKDLKQLQSQSSQSTKKIKTLVAIDTIKTNANFMKFDTKSSYVVIGDATDIWVDIAEWLINRHVENIIINRRDTTKRSQLSLPHIKKNKHVSVYENQNILSILDEARKLGPISVVYYLSMNGVVESSTLMTLDKAFRNRNGHFVAVTKTQGFISELCTVRNNAGFPSTNFIWEADEMIINENLEFVGKINGRDPIIHVSPLAKLSRSGRVLSDLLPSSIEDFCSLGSSLESEVRITPMKTLTGVNREATKEFTPLIFIAGLQNDPIKVLQPIVSNFLYPAFCVEIPDRKLSVPKMASFILPEIVKMNKGHVFNLVGISWGTNLAMELTKQLEETDAIVGLTLIEGPFLSAKTLVTKSLEFDLVNFIQGHSKSSGNVKVQSEILSEKTWLGKLNRTLPILNLSPDKEKDFYRAAMFIYNNLQALIDHDTKNLHFKGPLTILVSGKQSFDDKIMWKLSKAISVNYFLGTSEELMASKKLWTTVHGSAVSQAMTKSTVHSCSWPLLEEFMIQKTKCKLGEDFQPVMKFSSL